MKALDCEKCIFFPHLARIEKCLLKKCALKKKKKKEQAKSKKTALTPIGAGRKFLRSFLVLFHSSLVAVFHRGLAAKFDASLVIDADAFDPNRVTHFHNVFDFVDAEVG